jgi:hypothetical protein
MRIQNDDHVIEDDLDSLLVMKNQKFGWHAHYCSITHTPFSQVSSPTYTRRNPEL